MVPKGTSTPQYPKLHTRSDPTCSFSHFYLASLYIRIFSLYRKIRSGKFCLEVRVDPSFNRLKSLKAWLSTSAALELGVLVIFEEERMCSLDLSVTTM